jgi:hypothetical protein
MAWIDATFDWAKSNQSLLWWLGACSIAMFALTPVAVGWALVRLPRDYFTNERRRPLGSWSKSPALRVALLAGKNLLGVVLIAAGLLMLVIPGQGMLTLVVGLALTDFPGKFRLEQWIVERPSVWRSINWLRRRARREPLQRPDAGAC